MKRRSLPAAAAAVAALSLLLAACGGSDDDNANADDKIKGADSATPSPSPSDSAAGRPEIELPDDAKNVFEDTETGDPKKDAVLADNADMVNALDDAIFRGSTDTDALNFFLADIGRMKATQFIKGYLDDNHAWAGTTRYFDRQVSFRDDGAAVVIYCADERDAYLIDAKTGEADNETSAGTKPYVLYNTRHEQNEQGVWQTVNVISDRGAAKCKP
ncbi:hypothetical protein [Streptomyces sp. MAR4 CNX-425]|uniref:hypothetical protein n=1 Tax=Streptomyces sp. MAR4 CNX-425 TaxID=3406343 RepID=UPI003B50D7D3